jgi:DNA-binding response OmpR family regulator
MSTETMPDPAETADDLQCAGEVRLLVIDDDPATCLVIEAALAHKDFLVQVVTDPARVEATLKTRRDGEPAFHLIVLDYILPGLDSEQVLGWVQQHQPEAAVMVVTGFPTMEGALNCLRARTFDYLTKPFQIAQLRQTVLRCLQSRGLLRMTEGALVVALGAALRERRKGLGLTLTDVAKRSKVSVGYLSQIELGKCGASVETLYRLSLTLRVRLSDLFEAVQRGM